MRIIFPGKIKNMASIEVSFGEKVKKSDAKKYRRLVDEAVGNKVENVSDLEQHGNFGFYVDVHEDKIDEIEDEILNCLPDNIDVGTRQTYF